MERSTTGSILRTTQAWCLQLCEKQTLSHGIAYYSERFAQLRQANQFREVVVESADAVPSAFSEANDWFEEHNLRCDRWAPADGRANDELADFLVENGFRKQIHTVMTLASWVDLSSVDNVRVLPARSMRAALRTTHIENHAPGSQTEREMLADACQQRLDDPQFDMFVATVDGKPAGRCALYQVGDIARVIDLNVLPAFVDADVDTAMVSHALVLAKRLAMRNICVQIDEAEAQQRRLFARFGFVADGTIEEFDRVIPSDHNRSSC